jgi:hypothetical protein
MRNRIPIGVLMLLSAGLVPGQQTPDQAARDKKSMEAMYLVASATGADRVVTGKPFAAESVTETVQTLADGNRNVRHNVTSYYRDRSGRTRREQTIETLGPSTPVTPVHLIVISDPVGKMDYILDPTNRTARAFGRIEVPAPDRPSGADPGERIRQDLGVRTIEGLECRGTRETVTIQAGRTGNERPIVAVTETWYAPSIEAMVSYTARDPRSGETTYTLRHVIVAEQSRTLFELPRGYKVEPAGKVGVMRKPEDRP